MLLTFGELTGLLMSDFLEARRQTDCLSASLSEDYHVDPLMKGMPIPRYIISEADVDLPVQVVGVRRSVLGNQIIDDLIQRIQRILPTYLYRGIKNSYYLKQEDRVKRANGQLEPNAVGLVVASPANGDGPGNGAAGQAQVVRLSEVPELKASYKASTAGICALMAMYMRTYLEESNLSILKLLDFSDAFEDTLRSVCKQEFGTYPDAQTPFIDKDSLKALCKAVAGKMFFEFKHVFQQTDGVLVDPQTGKLGAHGSPDTLMRVRLKIKSQDVDFIVNQDEEGEQVQRFLSLN